MTKPFRFTNSWLQKPDLKDIIREAWEKRVGRGPPLLEFTWKLNNAKRAIKLWVKRSVRMIVELRKTHKDLENHKIELFQDLTSTTKQRQIICQYDQREKEH